MTPTPISNRKLTLLRKLNQKKYRQKEQLFVLEGARAVEQVLQNRALEIKALVFDESQQCWMQENWRNLDRKIESYSVSSKEFADVTDTDTPQGILAICHMPRESDVKDFTQDGGLVVALDAVQDPGNLGTIIRTASWFGVRGMMSGKGTVDLFHPKVVRATAGATGVVPHLNGNLSALLPQFEEAGWSIFLLDAGSEAVPLSAVSSIEKAVIVTGNEAHGVDPDLITDKRQKVRISSPKNKSGVESLNAAMATSIALYDLSGKLSVG